MAPSEPPADDLPAPPTREQIAHWREELGDRVRETPVWAWQGFQIGRRVGDTEVLLKLELFQFGGSFKARGALSVMLQLDAAQLQRGVTAVSAGNHAIATAYAASVLGSHAKVVMPSSANPARVRTCRELGAEVVQTEDVAAAFVEVQRIADQEGRHFVHPFEGPWTSLGTATLGLEFAHQAPDLDAVLIPIGGGGLCGGVSRAFKLFQPRCRVYGVEPEGSAVMQRSFDAGGPVEMEGAQTIADSLNAPHTRPLSYRLCRDHVDQLVTVTDAQMVDAMALLFQEMKLAVEPAGAATLAALLGPLRAPLENQRVGLVVCGTNIDAATHHQLLQQAGAA